MVKASSSKAEDPGFESCWQRDFPGSSHTSDLKIGTPVAALPGTWYYRFSTGTGQPGVSILWLGKVQSLICSFCLSVAARKIEQIRPWDTLACCWDIKQPTTTQTYSRDWSLDNITLAKKPNKDSIQQYSQQAWKHPHKCPHARQVWSLNKTTLEIYILSVLQGSIKCFPPLKQGKFWKFTYWVFYKVVSVFHPWNKTILEIYIMSVLQGKSTYWVFYKVKVFPPM